MKEFADTLTAWGPMGLFLLAAIDSAGVPLPAAADALVVATAVLHPELAWYGALAAIVGSLIGCLFLYFVGRRGGKAYLDRITADGRAATFRQWFDTYGVIAVFIPTLVPIPLPVKIAVLSAGALGVRPRTFIIVVLAARIPRYLGLAWLGLQLGHDAVPWVKDHVWQLTAFAVLLGMGLMLLAKWHARRIAQTRQVA